MRFGDIGLRSLVTLSSAGLATLSIISLTALLSTSAEFQRSLDTVARDTRSAAIADEVGVSVLLYQRLSNLLVVTGESELADAKVDVVRHLETLRSRALDLVGGAQEQVLLDRLWAALAEYLQKRNERDAEGLELEEIVRQTSPYLSEVLAVLTALRELNDLQIQIAQHKADQVQLLSKGFGMGAGALLMVGLAIAGFAVRRFVTRPMVNLRDSMAAFKDGDNDARNEVVGVRELAELARIFNEMADTLAKNRQAQLAFLAGVAHDLRSPLSTLRNGIYVLEHEQSEARRSLMGGSLDSQVDMLARMIDDLLDATRIEAGQLELECVQFDARHLLEEIVAAYVTITPDHQLVVDVPEHPVMLNADRLRIEQVMRNLLSNAIKYSRGGRIVVAVTTAGDDAILSVTDHGIGIPESEFSNIFLPFRRLKHALAPGVGLGLSVVRHIVIAHGGTIDVASEVGVGSTFRVKLRRYVAPQVANDARYALCANR